MKRKVAVESCPCGRGRPYAECCARWHGGAPAPDAEFLMRSRYSAYAMGLDDYLLATWHPDTRPTGVTNDDGHPLRWLGLDVLRHESGGDEAVVEFVARYKHNGRAGRMHETSRFVRQDGRWFYLGGELGENGKL